MQPNPVEEAMCPSKLACLLETGHIRHYRATGAKPFPEGLNDGDVDVMTPSEIVSVDD
jgi:hypothetical protein